MSEFLRVLLVLILYRSIAIIAGVVVTYLGYKLFVLGIYQKAGELKAGWSGKSLALRQAAPGTFFALFGTAVVVVSLWRGIDINEIKKNSPEKPRLPEHIANEAKTDDGQISSIVDKTKTGPLSPEDFKKLKEWITTTTEWQREIKVWRELTPEEKNEGVG